MTVQVIIDLPDVGDANNVSLWQAVQNAATAASGRNDTRAAHALAVLASALQPSFVGVHLQPAWRGFACHRCHGATTVQLVGPGAKPSPCPDCGGTGKSVKS